MIGAARAWFARWGGWALSGVLLLLFAPLIWWHRRREDAERAELPGDVRERMAEAARPALERAADQEHAEAQAHLREAAEAAQRAHAEREAIRRATPDELLRRSEEYARRKRAARARRAGPLVVALGLLTARPVLADDVVPLDRAGVPGFWVERETFRDLLADAEELPTCQLRLDKLHLAAANDAQALEAVRALWTTERASSQALAESLTVRTRERDQARRERDAWYRSPWMVSTAFVLGAALSGWGAYSLVVR